MKKLLLVILAILLTLALTSCGNDASSSSTQIDTSSIMSEAEMDNTDNTASENTDTVETPNVTDNTTAQNIQAQYQQQTQQITIPGHTHSYTTTTVAPTCTASGYTKHSCSCGDSYIDNYTEPAHNFNSNYICSICGEVDKSHAYEYLKQWLLTYGSTYGEGTSINSRSSDKQFFYGITYYATDEHITLSVIDYQDQNNNNDDCFFGISIKSQTNTYDYGCISSSAGAQLEGSIVAEQYTSNSPLNVDYYSGSKELRQLLIELARSYSYMLLYTTEDMLTANNVGITISDLGFTSFK